MAPESSDLNLSPTDTALVQEAKWTGVPVVTSALSGRSLILGDALVASDAVIAALASWH